MSRAPGSFVWADLVPADQERAIAFYVELLEWWTLTAAPEDGGYAMAFLGEQGLEATVGGISKTIPGVPPVWTAYLATDDIDTSVALATEHGGRVIMPVHVAERLGRVAIVTEPSGVPFGLWESTVNDGFGAAPGPGAIAWTEFVVPDAAAAARFFGAVFGLEAEALDGAPGFTYQRLSVPGDTEPEFGIYEQPGSATSHVYIRVADADAIAARVVAAGGEVVDGPSDSPFGAVLEIRDTEGARVRLIGPAPDA